jgi:serine/threonine protein kinase
MSKGYDKGVDYWAFGCLLYELYLAKTPFQADFTTKIFQNIIAADKVLQFPPRMDPQHVALIKRLLSVNPAFRLGNLSGGIDDIINDPFFSTVNWASLLSGQVVSPFQPPVKNSLDSSNFDQYDEDDNIPEYLQTQDYFSDF